MDGLDAVLAAQRADGAFVIRSHLTPPWSIRVEDGAPLTLVVATRGDALLVPDDGPAVGLSTGDAVLVRGPGHYALADASGRTPQAVIDAEQRCTRPDGSPLSAFRDLGVLTWGNVPDGTAAPTVLLTATYVRTSQVAGRLLAHLPPVVVVPRADQPATVGPLVALLTDELDDDRPGQGAVLDRVVDLLVVAVLRAWSARPDARAPRWLPAASDPVVGPALRRLQHEPHRPWTVASLAAESALSRAAFARRFARVVGEPPMAYLSRWRLDLAADLLRDTDLVLEAIAARVGYASAFSLSDAFVRQRGMRPSDYRSAARAR